MNLRVFGAGYLPRGGGARVKLAAAMVLAGAAALLAGCQSPTTYARGPNFDRGVGSTAVLVMPIDIELAELTTGGMIEPHADWTEQAKSHVSDLLSDDLQAKDVRRIDYRAPADPERERAIVQVQKLHEAVGNAITTHYFLPRLRGQPQQQLPTKQSFDWTLGPAAARLRDEYGSDYALFVHVRDSYSTAGRVALSIVTGVLFGYVPPGGTQSGFASLVDLRSGDVVWFNLLARGHGDLRTREVAKETVAVLLKEFPK